tara:strand:+ start:1172 stop:1795 length:624 start_codon:yes stop_codon:yes gene_type:complete
MSNNKIQNEIFSKDYSETIKLYKKMHLEGTDFDNAENTFDGKSLRFFIEPIKKIILQTQAKSLIDFGCGKAKYYLEQININNINYENVVQYWEINDYKLYDPGVEKYSKYPNKKADALLCIDVIEHIPEKDVIKFINEIFKLSNKFIFMNIACYPAIKNLPDGRNVHLTIKDPDEWKKIISTISKNFPNIVPYVICSTGRKKFISLF